MTYTLADAVRTQFERDHPGNRGVLKCTSCYRRKDRNDFRETPWHGRAAACKRCEGADWFTYRYEELLWKLEQEREKNRALRRHIMRTPYRRAPQRYLLGLESFVK